MFLQTNLLFNQKNIFEINIPSYQLEILLRRDSKGTAGIGERHAYQMGRLMFRCNHEILSRIFVAIPL